MKIATNSTPRSRMPNHSGLMRAPLAPRAFPGTVPRSCRHLAVAACLHDRDVVVGSERATPALDELGYPLQEQEHGGQRHHELERPDDRQPGTRDDALVLPEGLEKEFPAEPAEDGDR